MGRKFGDHCSQLCESRTLVPSVARAAGTGLTHSRHCVDWRASLREWWHLVLREKKPQCPMYKFRFPIFLYLWKLPCSLLLKSWLGDQLFSSNVDCPLPAENNFPLSKRQQQSLGRPVVSQMILHWPAVTDGEAWVGTAGAKRSSGTCKVTCGKSAHPGSSLFLHLLTSHSKRIWTPPFPSSYKGRKRTDRTMELLSKKKPQQLENMVLFPSLTKGWCKWNITKWILAKLKTNSSHHLMGVKRWN